MEQPNVSGNMAMQGNAMQSMQRAQPGNMSQQIHAQIMNNLRSKINEFSGGWQAMFDIRERANRIMQLITMLRQINPDVRRCMQTAEMWEERMLKVATSKEQYFEEMGVKMREITGKRQQQVSQINLGAMPNGNRNGGAQGGNNMMNMNMNVNMNMQNGMMMPQNMQNNAAFLNGMNMGMQPGQMNGTPGQNPMFPTQLQRQMQPSPLPLNQQQQQQNNTMDPSALQVPAQPQQQQQQQSQLQNGQMGQIGAVGQAGPAGQQQQLNKNTQAQLQAQAQAQAQAKAQAQAQAQTQAQGTQAVQNPQPNEIMFLAKRMYDNVPDERKSAIRTQWLSSLPEHARASATAGNADPLIKFFYTRAQAQLQQRRQNGGVGMPQNNNNTGPNANTLNVPLGANVPPRPPSQTGGQNIDFSSIMGQQATALKLQESGEQVVPASNNNNMGLGNQMNVPPNINPNMLTNQNNQGGQGNNPQLQSQMQNQMQMYMMQQNAQQRERLQKQLMAQQHAVANRQQHSQLQGQPGGLHTPNAFNGGALGQVNSPAMPNLNRSMAPPGQGTPGTPQPNRQQPVPQAPVNAATQLQQHHQNMLNQNSQQQQEMAQTGPNNIDQQALYNMLNRVPLQYRQRLLDMPPAQMQQMLARFKAGAMGGLKPVGQPGPQPGPQPGMPTMPTMGMGPTQQGDQQIPNMMQQQIPNAVPDFNSMQNQKQASMDPTAQLQQLRLNQQRQIAFRNLAMDSRPFPKVVLTNLGISVPATVQLWGDLKRHVQQNQMALPQGLMERLQQQQAEFYKQNPAELQQAMQMQLQRHKLQQGTQPNQVGQPGQQEQQQARQPQQQPQNAGTQASGMMANGPAPQAQMVPPAPMMQVANQGMPPNGNQGLPNMPQMPPPSLQEIQAFRSKVPQAAHLGDDHIRQVIIRNRIQKFRDARQNMQNAMQGQPNQQNSQPMNLPNANQVPAQRTVQQLGSQQTPLSNSLQKPSLPQNNDVIEIAGLPSQQHVPQATAMQATQSQTQNKPSQQDMIKASQQEKISNAQRQRTAAQGDTTRKVQGQMGVTNHAGNATTTQAAGQHPNQTSSRPMSAMSAADVARLKAFEQHIISSTPRGPAVEGLDAAGLEQAKLSLQKMWRPLMQIQTTYPWAVSYGFEDDLIKSVMRAKVIVQQNVMDGSGDLKDYLSATPAQLQDLERVVAGYMARLKQRRDIDDNAKRQAAASQANGDKGTLPAVKAAQASTMAVSNSQQGHARKVSTNKAPPAPTENKTFDWTGQGIPKYNARNELTADKLKPPPQKRRKTDGTVSQVSTPAGQVGTPTAAGSSPVVASGKTADANEGRKVQAQVKAEAEKEAEQKKYHCEDLACEASLRGFDTEDLLKAHQQSEHQAVSDSVEFLLSNAATALGMNNEGKPIVQAVASVPKTKPVDPKKPRTATARDLRKDELAKHEIDQINKGVILPTVKEKIAKKQTDFDAAYKEVQKSMTFREALTQKLDIPTPSTPIVEDVIQSDTMADFGWPELENLTAPGEEYDQPLTFERIAEMYREGWVETDPINKPGIYELRPGHDDSVSSAEQTPNGSEASRSSDVSQSDALNFLVSMENMNADIWVDGSGGVGQSMVSIYHQIQDMMKEDVTMSGGDGLEDGDASRRKRKPDEALWSPPIEDIWDHYFQPMQGIQA